MQPCRWPICKRPVGPSVPTEDQRRLPVTPALVPPGQSTPWSRLLDLLLTTEPRQRLRLSQAGFALLLMAMCVLFMHYVVWVGGAASAPVWWWTLASLGGVVSFYLLIRSGWSRSRADPSLTVGQMIYSIACAAAAYALAGSVRGAVFPILMIIQMFGMFRLRAGTALRVGLYAVAIFGATMALMAWQRPEVYVPAVELGHFLMLLFMLPTVSVLAGRINDIRASLAARHHELVVAHAQIQALVMRDDLTGLLNRRHMQSLLEQENQRCSRSGRNYCLALLDIDHFKLVNDQHGHAAGDQVLQVFAQAALQVMRGSDVMARWGGEEFVLLLTDARIPLAVAGVERVRLQVADMDVVVGGHSIQVTVSAGVTEHRAGESLAQTLERADRQLYDAKAQGRNRVIVG